MEVMYRHIKCLSYLVICHEKNSGQIKLDKVIRNLSSQVGNGEYWTVNNNNISAGWD